GERDAASEYRSGRQWACNGKISAGGCGEERAVDIGGLHQADRQVCRETGAGRDADGTVGGNATPGRKRAGQAGNIRLGAGKGDIGGKLLNGEVAPDIDQTGAGCGRGTGDGG